MGQGGSVKDGRRLYGVVLFFSGCLSFLISPLGESFRVALLSPRDSESKVNLPRVCLTMYCVFVVSLVFALQVQMKREDREYRRDHE